MAEDRDDRRRDGRDRFDDDERRRMRCRPHFGDIVERIEILKRVPPDDAIEVLKTIIEAAFFAGVACGCCECGCREERDRDRDDDDRRRRFRD